MCVIQIADDKPLTADMIRAGFAANSHGSGVAWREEVGGKKVVKWKKGIQSADEVVDLVANLALPYVVHHRIASIGPKIPEMTHPFPVRKDVSTDLEGSTTGPVLFHNGTWHQWDHEMFKAALLRGVKLPRAPFSDTRMMAWITHLIGPGFLEKIDEKVILFSPEEIEIFGKERGWTCVEGIWCSNGGFQSRMGNNKSQTKEETQTSTQAPITPLRAIINNRQGVSGGERQEPGFRPGPASVAHTGFGTPDGHQQGQVQGREVPVSTRIAAGVVCAVENVGDRPSGGRRPLISDPGFVDAYKQTHGHPPPFAAKPVQGVTGNVKRFRSSGRVGSPVIGSGFAARGGDAELSRRRRNAAAGISNVL